MQPYAALNRVNHVLTFYYGEKPQSARYITIYDVDTNGGKDEIPAWCSWLYPASFKEVRFDKSFASVRMKSCANMFYWCDNLRSIDFDNFCTDSVTTMRNMFYRCSNLQTLDLSNFNTENVTDMAGMFNMCMDLQTIDLSSFNTENVTNMWGMFISCNSLQTLDLLNFNTENVTCMGQMFWGCRSLQTLDLSNFKTDNVTDMSSMFCCCAKLQTLDLSNFNTENVTCMGQMFWGCRSLQTLDLSSFNTDSVTDMSSMFCDCGNLQTLDLSNFNTENVTYMDAMFSGCKNLQTLDLSNFNTGKVTGMSEMFSDCDSLQTLDLSSFKTDSVTDMGEMFSGCAELETIYVGNDFVTAGVTSSDNMFNANEKLVGAVPYSESNSNDVTNANYKTGYFSCYYLIGEEKRPIAGEPLKTDSLVLKDGKDFSANNDFEARTANYSRVIGGQKWGTLCLPYAFNASGNSTAEFYEIKQVSNDTLYLNLIDGTVEAGVPVIVCAKGSGDDIEINAVDAQVVNYPMNNTDKDYNLVGSFAGQVVPGNGYVISNDCFMQCSDLQNAEDGDSSVFSSGAFRAYLQYTGSQVAPKTLKIVFDEGATAIKPVRADIEEKTEYYDVTGLRLKAPQKGVNIIKIGKKTKKVVIY